MSRTAGTYTAPASSWNPAISAANATIADWNALLIDMSNALTQSMSLDGQSTPTADLTMGGFRLKSLAAATAVTDAISAGDVQKGTWNYLTTVAGTNTITALATGLATYTAGQVFRFIAAAKNTGATTLNVNSLGAKAITKFGTTALVSGDIPINAMVTVAYDGTQFQLQGVATQGAAASGWYQLPNGVIEQFGSVTSAGGGGTVTVTFPVAFTSALQSMVAMASGNSTTPAIVWRDSTSTTGAVLRSDAGAGNVIFWRAVGS